ncbi:MAG: DMT family transporter [Gallionella sp.]
MPLASLLKLILLAAIWGGSFLFTRISVPYLGAILLVEYRVALAAVCLTVAAMFLGKSLNARQHWRHYLALGVLNAAMPFLLFAFAALTLTASALSILNATTPIWGAVIGAVWSRQRISRRTAFGLALGVAGVGTIVGLDHWATQPGAGTAVAAALLATVCYGIATTYARHTTHVDSYSNAHGSMWAASLFVVPMLPFASTSATPGIDIVLAVVALGVVCTGIAFLLYFRLVREIGATSTLTVTFLIPVFGILWGHLFLGEVITASMIAGSLIVIFGTALATGFNPVALLVRKVPNKT